MLNSAYRAAAAAAFVLVLGAPAGAQFVQKSTFAVTTTQSASIDVAPAPNGTMLFAFNSADGSHVFTRRFNAAGVPLSEATIDTATEWADEVTVAPDGHGGFLSAWREPVWLTPTVFRPGLFTHRIDHLGDDVGHTVRMSVDGSFANAPAIAGLPTSALYSWYDLDGVYVRRAAPSGEPIGDAIQVSPTGGPSTVLPTRDGGYLLVYRDVEIGNLNGLVVMQTRGPSDEIRASATISETFFLSDAALAPAEDVAGAVGTRQAASGDPIDIVLRRFALDGTPLGDDVVVHTGPSEKQRPQIAFDTLGNTLVTWGEDGGVWARVLDAADVPIGPPVQVGTKPVLDFSILPALRTVRLTGGSFVNAWTDGGHAWASFVTLCPAGLAVCGDGVRSPTCEACDDGPGNSDTLPDACRTNCRRAGCGDGVLDTGEACDDGNTASCDGCSADCTVEVGATCGDGIVLAGCEQCDDTNTINGDGCSDTCTIERVYGGGPLATDCFAEWRVDNAANQPREAKTGGINRLQRCVDNDARCDFDGGVPGGCTFHVAVCANNTNVEACPAPDRLLRWELRKPSAKLAITRPALAAVRAAFDAVPAVIVGPGTPEVCSADVAVTVPLRGAADAYHPGKLGLAGLAELYDGRTDKDTLKLICLPAP